MLERFPRLMGLFAVLAVMQVKTVTPSRLPRATSSSQEYFVDILVIADYAYYNSWLSRSNSTQTLAQEEVALQDIKRYLTLVIQEVSDRYSRLQNNSVIHFRPVSFYISKSSVESALWTSGQAAPNANLNGTKVLNDLMSWLQNRSSTLPDYDHAMLFTGGNLGTNEKGDTKGKATVGTLCKGDRWRSVSVIEDRGGFQCVGTAVHELGHSFNALHDGLQNQCQGSDRYVMSTGSYNITEDNRRNPWLFSSCTAQEIASHVTNVQSTQCLQNALSQNDVPNVTGVIPGQLYTPDTACKHLHGSTSFFCFGGNASDVCTSMPCRNPEKSEIECFEYLAPTGTSCGNKKWCQQGECVQSSAAPSLPEDCPLGDNTLVTINDLKCSELSRQQPFLCYESTIRKTCCYSCGLIQTQIPGCEYGDKQGQCTLDYCSDVYTRNLCCNTCGSASQSTSFFDGIPRVCDTRDCVTSYPSHQQNLHYYPLLLMSVVTGAVLVFV